MEGDGRALVGRDGAAMDGFREALKSTQDRDKMYNTAAEGEDACFYSVSGSC